MDMSGHASLVQGTGRTSAPRGRPSIFGGRTSSRVSSFLSARDSGASKTVWSRHTSPVKGPLTLLMDVDWTAKAQPLNPGVSTCTRICKHLTLKRVTSFILSMLMMLLFFTDGLHPVVWNAAFDHKIQVSEDRVWEFYFLSVVTFLGLVLISDGARPEVVFFTISSVSALCRIITPNQWMTGFGNPATLGVAMLFVVGVGVNHTRALDPVILYLLGSPGSRFMAQLRLSLMVTMFSSILSNTVVFAIMFPLVRRWCILHNVNPQTAMVPLSYSIVLGGCVTAIGNTANVIAISDQVDEGDVRLSAFCFTPVGAVVALVGVVCLMLFSGFLIDSGTQTARGATATAVAHTVDGLRLPRATLSASVTRVQEATLHVNPEEFALVFFILPDCELVGRSADVSIFTDQFSPLRFLHHVSSNEVSPPAAVFAAGDLLVLAGSADAFCVFRGVPGFEHAVVTPPSVLGGGRLRRLCFEAVIQKNSPLLNSWVVDDFVERYRAVPLAARRLGFPLLLPDFNGFQAKEGDIILVEAFPNFQETSAEVFSMIKPLTRTTPPRHAWAAGATNMDRCRSYVCVIGLVLLVVIEVCNQELLDKRAFSIPVMASCLVLILIAFHVLDYSSVLVAAGGSKVSLFLLATAFPVSIALQETGVFATAASLLSQLCLFLAGSDVATAQRVCTAILAFAVQVFAMLTSPTVSVIFLLRFGDCLSVELNLPVELCTLIIVFSSSLIFVDLWASSVHIVCLEAGGYDRRKTFLFDFCMQALLTSVAVIGADWFWITPSQTKRQ